jgi:hypothetical protein
VIDFGAWVISAAIVCTGRVQIDGQPHDCTGKVESFAPQKRFSEWACGEIARDINHRWNQQNIVGFAKCVPAGNEGYR